MLGANACDKTTKSQLYCVSKKVPTFKLSVTLWNFNRFSKFLHCWKAFEICYKTYTTLSAHLLKLSTQYVTCLSLGYAAAAAICCLAQRIIIFASCGRLTYVECLPFLCCPCLPDRFWPHFQTLVALELPSFRNGVTHLKSKKMSTIDDWPMSSPTGPHGSDICPGERPLKTEGKMCYIINNSALHHPNVTNLVYAIKQFCAHV